MTVDTRARPRLTVYMAQSEATSPKFCHAFAAGCGSQNVTSATKLVRGEVALWGSPRVWSVLEAARAAGRTWFYGDHGYLRRGEYFRITKNAFQHTGLGLPESSERFDSLELDVKPWRTSGDHILVCPPGQITGVLYGFNVDYWLAAVVSKIRAFSRRPIRIRNKPAGKGGPTLIDDLRDAWALVTWRSNSAVEALLEGVPVFPLSDCAAASQGLSDLSKIETPYKGPSRRRFFSVLANNQWTLPEIESGVAWKELSK